ncbi:MAG: SDR family oxidoreductase [Rhodospirillales bacterium]|jgi:3-oxoacyl-[acyl-carrier protein] reductase|nr:SDR family oxidoreductase [Rhodospirillales bacterium]MBT3907833.1 SDR family oxidoreductase [Rhodospirillaceae bacterium]MBT5035732.1 SDR family oxidoreductase [Rhodospirillaceae bacterium]MBT6218735.1 SDR family oxidoreductase [Rhodospirillaceae bacterium]MBT6363629.1 SDR family oxidoreductase [Rhodospirillaceae bacterium]
MNSKSKTALITGSGKNIGRGVALGLAKDGFDIVVNGVSNEAAVEKTVNDIKALGVEAIGVMADIGDPDGLSGLIKDAMDAFGGVDVLVNNAAIRPSAGFIEMSDEDWMRVMNVNFGSVHGLSKAFLPGMVERCYGRIINFTGMHAMRGYVGRAHVSTSKHAVWGLTKSLGREFAAQGVTANVISPGPINGDYEDARTLDGIKATVAQVPANRMGEPSEIAALVKLLVSDEGGYINAQLLQINGGAQT